MQQSPVITFAIPKKTTVPIQRTYEVMRGYLKSIHVTIPPGHKGLAGMQVFIPGRQVAPSIGSADPFIYGDGQELDFPVDSSLDGPPYNVFVRGYNNDSFLDHSFIVRLTVE